MAAQPSVDAGVSALVLGTRGSELALAQARQVAAALEAAHPGLSVVLREIRTTGDELADRERTGPLDKGLFTKQLEEALLAGIVDAAVHSLKDLPVDLPSGLVLGAIPPRADPCEVLVSKHAGGLAGLPLGARVGTSSARRAKLLVHVRADLVVAPTRGNVPTRLRRLAESATLDAVLLAKAGLDRLGNPVPDGLFAAVEPDLLPAPGQGALGIECRAGDDGTRAMLAAIHDESTARCVDAERGLLRALGGGCASPVGALAQIHNGEVVLRAVIFGEHAR